MTEKEKKKRLDEWFRERKGRKRREMTFGRKENERTKLNNMNDLASATKIRRKNNLAEKKGKK